MPGMLLHIDGSKHQWFGDERWYDLVVILDDATSEIYYAQLVKEESTRAVMEGWRTVIENKGLFCALYSIIHRIRRRREAAANEISGLGKDGCRRSCGGGERNRIPAHHTLGPGLDLHRANRARG